MEFGPKEFKFGSVIYVTANLRFAPKLQISKRVDSKRKLSVYQALHLCR